MSNGYHYILFSIVPSTPDPFAIRHAMQNALIQAFGIVGGSLYVDVLWVAEDGSETVVRVRQPFVLLFSMIYVSTDSHHSDINKLVAAMTLVSTGVRMSKKKDSAFLPSLISAESTESSAFYIDGDDNVP